jgi:hypothetical protein
MSTTMQVTDEVIGVALSPLKSIRKHCLWCCDDQANEVRYCAAEGCVLHLYRFGRGPEQKPELTPLKSIRAKCLDCSCHSPSEVRNCEFTSCVLYPYRMGKNPNLKGKGKGNVEALRKWREAQALR